MYPPLDHKAMGLVERPIQTRKRQKSCMEADLNKKFDLQSANVQFFTN